MEISQAVRKEEKIMFEKYRFTEDSFGSECPDNWEEIADLLNDRLRAAFEEFDRIGADKYEYQEAADDIWEDFCEHGI